MAVEYKCCGTDFFIHVLIIVFLVMFAGMMSGLTLGLMSMSLVDLEVLAKSGTPKDRKYAEKILPVVRKQHLLLCTLLICNAAAMEALPIFLDSLVTAWGAILISVTLILLFGEAGKGGELTHDETTIIAGALELTEKIASDAMTPITETFAIDINAKLDRELMHLILEKGHSRVPVYYEQTTNIIGVILVKNLLTIHPEDEVPVKAVTIRRIPRVPETLPLYDILNEFQKGHSHIAVVVRQCNKREEQPDSKIDENSVMDVRVDVDVEKTAQEKALKAKRQLQKWKSFPNTGSNSIRGSSRSKKWSKDMYSDILRIDDSPLPKLPDEEEAVGIITMEDVIEELLQEEIFDETDHQFEDS
ncbi:DUF21 domain-containing protein At2g14520-like isoform X2 [Rhododendron vialii]|uniref:DUF21 domain-containing protein At2g14520-like isoform X2 n=1 Tax=Rhododendron vialii TaxID=182163 RepID=UPI00265DA059|nr:DUF21 domain-containing protein At2g14520-like isoform X2 [Rhododendron vialii]